MITKRRIIIAGLFLFYVLIRIYFCMQTDYFSSDESYFVIKQAEHIAQTGRPMISDSGRLYYFMPFYYYLIGGISLISSEFIALKIFNNILASSLIVIAFFLIYKLTKNFYLSIFLSIVSAFLPGYISETLNNLSPNSLFIPGSLALIYLCLEPRENINYIVPLTLILVLTSSLSVVLVIGIAVFLLISYFENLKPESIELEYISFFGFFYIWANFVIFKTAIIHSGISVIWLSRDVLSYSTLLLIASNIGFLPLLGGTYMIYQYLFKSKNKSMLLIIAMLLSSIIISFANLVPFEFGLIFAGEILVILFATFLKNLMILIKKTKLAAYETLISIAIICLLILTQILPGYQIIKDSIAKAPDENYVKSFKWLSMNSPTDSVVLASPLETEFIRFFSNRRPAFDARDVFSENEIAQNEIKTIYSDLFLIDTVRLLEKYDIDYIIISDRVTSMYGIYELHHAECLQLVYNQTIKIYSKGDCRVKKL